MSSMMGSINVQDFMDHLRANDLVITKRENLNDAALKMEILKHKQRKLLSKKWLSIREIIDGNLIELGSRSGVLRVIESRSDYDLIYKNINGVNKVLTSAIKQIRDERAIV